MLRAFSVFCLVLLIPSVAWAPDFTCSAPTAATSRISFLCEELRKQIRVDPNFSTWDADVCATEGFRQWLRDYDATVVATDSRNVVRDDVKNELEQWDAAFPPQYTSSYCGDSETNTEYGETCDLGMQNGVPGSGCHADCQIEGS